MKGNKETVIKIVSLIAAGVLFAVGVLLVCLYDEKKSEESIERRPLTTTVSQSMGTPQESSSAESAAVQYPIDINQATVSELTGVKGIGGITAGRIIDYRSANGKIHDIAELCEIDGVGEELCALIAEYFYVDESDYIRYTEATTAEKATAAAAKPAATRRVSKTTTTKTATSAVTTKRASFPLDINKAELDELMQIDGVGEGTAEKIIALRSRKGKITDMEQLLEIYGIGQDRLDMLCGYLYVSEADYSKASTTTAAASTAPATVTGRATAAATAKATLKTATAPPPTETQTSPAKAEKRRVNINEADAAEIADALQIDNEAAEKIVWLRERIHGYSNILEVLYLEDFDKRYDTEFYNSIKDHIYV